METNITAKDKCVEITGTPKYILNISMDEEFGVLTIAKNKFDFKITSKNVSIQ